MKNTTHNNNTDITRVINISPERMREISDKAEKNNRRNKRWFVKLLKSFFGKSH